MPAPRARTSPLLLAIPLTAALLGCSKPPPEAATTSQDPPVADAPKAAPTANLPSALPEARPTPFEADYRVRPKGEGPSVMLKVTDRGNRYSVGDEEHRVIVAYEGDEAALDRAYAQLRAAAFDRIETQPSREMTAGGTSMSLLAGSQRHSASDMGRIYPKDAWAAAYEASAKALESLLPPTQVEPGTKAAASIDVRWDASMASHRASIDLPVGGNFAAIAPVPGTGADVRIELAKAAPIQIKLRHGPPATETNHTFDPAKDAALLIAWDTNLSIPTATLLDAAALAARDAGRDAPPAPTRSPAPAPATP
jgi:hypothetical protein